MNSEERSEYYEFFNKDRKEKDVLDDFEKRLIDLRSFHLINDYELERIYQVLEEAERRFYAGEDPDEDEEMTYLLD